MRQACRAYDGPRLLTRCRPDGLLAAGEDEQAEHQEPPDPGDPGGTEVDDLFPGRPGGRLQGVQYEHGARGHRVRGRGRPGGLPVLPPPGPPAGPEGEAGVQLRAQKGGGDGDQRIGHRPGHRQGEQRHRRATGESDTPAAHGEPEEGSERTSRSRRADGLRPVRTTRRVRRSRLRRGCRCHGFPLGGERVSPRLRPRRSRSVPRAPGSRRPVPAGRRRACRG